MSVSRSARISRFTPLLLLVCLWLPAIPAQAAVGFRVSFIDSSYANPLARPVVRGLSAFQTRAILDIGLGGIVLAKTYDSTYSHVTYTQKFADTHLLQPTILGYETYKQNRWRYDTQRAWRDELRQSYKQASLRRSGEGVAIDLPYRIKSKTFRRLFGGDNVGVRVQGNIAINGNLRRQNFDELQSANMRNTNTSFRIDMVQQFTITGKVGQKVEVKVDQDSERLFDFENSLKLTYTGDEDEIVQKVEAGNVNLALGTKLATFSGQNKGLFGLKTQLKVGALSLTGIASLERGQKNRQSPNQDTQRARFTEKDFLHGVYFWLTDRTVSLNNRTTPNYRENYRNYNIVREHVSVTQQEQVAEVEVYMTIDMPSPTETELWGRAAALDFYADVFDSINYNDNNHVQSVWRKLNKASDYDLDPFLGSIRLRQRLPDGQALACAFATMGGDTFGTLRAVVDSTLRLILLRPRTPSPNDSTWNLMFRHVYSLQAANLDRNNFNLEIIREAGGTARDETGPPGDSRTYLTYYQFDLNGEGGSVGADGKVDDVSALIRWDQGELHFLDLTPFDPSGYFVNGQPAGWNLRALEGTIDSGGFTAPYLYNTVRSQHGNRGARWRFQTEFKGSTSVFNLGPLVLEGSEEVTLNGRQLQRGIDYSIDYLSGQLRILNEQAKAPGANLDITYESGRVFQLDKTTLLGARAEYQLWPESYIGGMVLYLNQKTLDRRVRIGNEPIRNTLWDMNTSLKFKPAFLTKAVNAIPLVRTETASELVVDAEVARVYPNPNSLQNPRTGDFNGLAFLDDFEGSRRSIPLGIQRRMWTVSSIPLDENIARRRGRLRWYNPNTLHQVPVRDVFPDRDVNSQVANTLQSLIMEFEPDSVHVETSWGGVMRYLGEGFADQSRSQFLEFWIKLPPPGQDQGKLIVDLGVISEDALPNDSMNSEDTPLQELPNRIPTREYGNGLLSPEEDTGLDGIADSDPFDMAHWNGLDQPAVPSYDDWDFAVNSTNFDKINGTERNQRDEGGGYPDSEDLNNNNNLDTENGYYSYTIELRHTSPYIVGGNFANNWRLFRIPINGDLSGVRREYGNADLTNVRWARMYLTGAAQPLAIEMVQADIVSNEWLPVVNRNDSSEYVSPAVVNTHENPGYESPPGVEGEMDPITNLRQREQSLVLKVNELNNLDGDSIPSEFFVAKNLYQAYSLLEYKRLKMFVHGGGIPGEELSPFVDGKYQLILRLGRNYDFIGENYYEIITGIRPGWHETNRIDVTLNELSQLQTLRREAAAVDSTVQLTGRYAFAYNPEQPEDSIAIRGNPTLGDVWFIALGVRLTPKYVRGRGEELWVDELRLSDIYKDPGTAAAINAGVNFGDFVTLQGSYNVTDADFHNVNTRINPQQSTNETWRGNATVNLHKVALERWGFGLPLTLAYAESHSAPRVVPGSDTRINPASAPDSIRASQIQFQYGLRYSKRGNSPNPLVRWTLEKLSAGWDFSREDRSDFNVAVNKSETNTAQAGYTFPTAKGRGIAPLWWIKGAPLLGRIGSPRFYYKPTKLIFGAQGSRREAYQRTRPQFYQRGDSITVSVQETRSTLFATQRSLNTGFAPFRPISLEYTRSFKGLVDSTRSWGDVIMGDFGQTNEITQSSTGNYQPEFTAWLRPTFNVTSSYGWGNRNLTQPGQESIRNQRNFGADWQLDFRTIFGGGGGGREARRERPRTPDLERRPAPGDSASTEPDSLSAPPPRGSPFAAFGKLFGPVKTGMLAIDPITLSYDNTAGHSQSGLVGQPGLDYQFGLSQSHGLSVASDTAGNPLHQSSPLRQRGEEINARSGLRLTRDIRTTFIHRYSSSENISSSSTGSVEQSMFWLAGKGGSPTSFPFIDLTADWSGLERLAFLDGVTKSVSLTSSLSNKVRETWNNVKSNVQSRDYNRQWNPLLGVNVSWKRDIDSQVRYNTSQTFTEQVVSGTKSRQSDQQVTATVSYTIRTGFRLPLLFLSKLRLQNQTTFSVNVDYRSQKQERTESANSDTYGLTGATSSWSLQPRMSYSFSNTVQGQAYVQIQQTKNDITQSKSRLFEFGIQVNIAIRG